MNKRYIQEVEDMIIRVARGSTAMQICVFQEKLNFAKYALFLYDIEKETTVILDFFNTKEGARLELDRCKRKVWPKDRYEHIDSFNEYFSFKDADGFYRAYVGSIYEE